MARISAADIEYAVRGVKLPTNRNGLVEQAEGNNANQNVIDAIRNLPEDEFRTAVDISKAFGEEINMARSEAGRLLSAADVEYAIKGVKFPSNRAGLVKQAQSNEANNEIIKILKNLPADDFRTAVDVSKAFGQEKRM